MKLAKLAEKKIFRSRIKSDEVEKKELWLGYLFGPSGLLLLNAVVSGYLNVYYTDVLQLSSLGGGLFLVLMPVLSKILDALTNIYMGQVIERTRTREGKARPWMLISAPLVCISAILLFTIPNSSDLVKALWITFSYNFYYCVSYTIYNMAHTLMMPLSTRDNKKRDTLAMFNMVAQCIVPGMFVSMLFPMFILSWMGVDQSRWLMVVTIFSLIALPAILLEYYFTKERVTESEGNAEDAGKQKLSLVQQLKACMHSKYWVMAMTMVVAGTLLNGIVQASRLYYCNWVLSDYTSGATTYSLINVLGQAPLGFGIFLVWPLTRKFGKRNCILIGSLIAAVGMGISVLNARNFVLVIVGMVIASFGALPNTYTGTAVMADAMDYVEYRQGFRCDGLTASIYSIVNTIAAGIGTGVLNLGLALFNYQAPGADSSFVAQSAGLQTWLIVCALGASLLGHLINFGALLPYKLDKEMPVIREEMLSRTEKTSEMNGDVME